jgi:hypothetical protein
MYPPREESDSERVARLQAESNWFWRWIGPLLWSVLLLMSACLRHRWWALAAWMVFLAAWTTESILEKNRASAGLRWGLKIASAGAYVAVGIAGLLR